MIEMANGIWSTVFGNAGVYIQLLRFFVVFFIGILVTKAVFIPLVRRLAMKKGTGKKTKHSLANIVGVVGFFISFTAGLQAGEFGNLVTVIGAVAGAATVAIGWGMRDQIGSVVSGVFIHLYPSFVQGDYISVGDVQGTIKEINLTDTQIRSPNGEKLVIPNNYVTTRPLTNHTKGTVTQDTFSVDVRSEKVDAATTALKDIAMDYDEVLNSPEPKILYADMGKESVTADLVYYVQDNKDIRQIRSTVIQRFNDTAVEHDFLSEPAETEAEEPGDAQ